MATYKVLQDIEAEDKFLGPLTLKQFIFAAIVVICGYLSFWSITKGFPYILILTLPIMVACGILAWPWSKVQSTETWLFAKIRFYFKPHRRIWDQTGMQQLVTITAPKRIEKHYTNGLSETEVSSRLKALAATIDSRGWAVKNVNVNLFTQPQYGGGSVISDRLIAPISFPQEVSGLDIQASDDILDESNPVAYQLDQLVSKSNQAHRKEIINQMHHSGDNGSQSDSHGAWFSKPVTTKPLKNTKQAKRNSGTDGTASKTTDDKHKIKQVKPAGDPAIMRLASNNDLDVATIARQADQHRKQGPTDEEVVVPLR